MHWKRVLRNGAPVLQTSRPRRDPAERFWEKVDRSCVEDACWPWLASRDELGYGFFRLVPGENMRKAHRCAWILTFGEPEPGMSICHRCDNPPCCNPSHLFAAPHQENMRDRNRKQRTTKGRTGHHGESSGKAAKLRLADVNAIRDLYAQGGLSQTALGERFGVSQTQVGRIVRGERWSLG